MEQEKKRFKFGLLPRVLVAIALGIVCSLFFPMWAARAVATFNSLFGNFLAFIIPLLILGLVAPDISNVKYHKWHCQRYPGHCFESVEAR